MLRSTRTCLLALTAVLSVLNCRASGPKAPPAEQVMAEVHAASRLAVGLLERTPTSGVLEEEAALVTSEAAAGLGEVMGWGADRFDNVAPEVMAVVVENFQQGFRTLQEFPGGEDYAQVRELAATMRGHLDAIRAVVERSAPGHRDERELHQFAVVLRHHAAELPGSPLTPSNHLAAVLGLRTLSAGLAGLESDLAGHPALAEALAPQLQGLSALASNPPPCTTEPEPGDACIQDLSARAVGLLEVVVAATAIE